MKFGKIIKIKMVMRVKNEVIMTIKSVPLSPLIKVRPLREIGMLVGVALPCHSGM